MDNSQRLETINNLKMAIELAGDGGMQPFTDEEYQDMYHLLDELSTNDEANTSTNDDTVLVASEDVEFNA